MNKMKCPIFVSSMFFALSLVTGCSGSSTVTIKFVNYDGTVLYQLDDVEKGKEVAYQGNKPVHFDDASNYYVFTGWDKDITVASKDETYTATFSANPLTTVTESPDEYIDVLPDSTEQGAILHAFCWTFKQMEEQLPYIAKAGYKSIQTLPVQTPKSNGSSWWAYYQPLSFSIAEESPLGTKDDLISLCEEADNYNISIIVDVVFNHLANIADGELEPDGTPKVSPQVANYEPEIYAHRNDATDPTFHHNKQATGSGADTQYYPYGDLPDLNTGNSLVQQRAREFLYECIDAGVDGFRFDAAKHIETSQDPDYPSYFWENTLGMAKTYYRSKTGKDLFAYGEILGRPTARPITVYTDLMDINDDAYNAKLINSMTSLKAEYAATSNYRLADNPTALVNWLESHDSYTTSALDLNNDAMALLWAVLASRKDTHGLYLARTDHIVKNGDKQHSVGVIGDYFFRKEALGAPNRFHNRFLGADEYQNYDGSIYYNERVSEDSKGAIVVDLARKPKIVVDFAKLGTDVYYDQMTGKAVTVRNGHATIELDESGIAVLTKTHNPAHPELDITDRGGLFVDEKSVTLTAKNAIEASYKINGGASVSFSDRQKVTFTRDQAVDGKIILSVDLANGTEEYHETFEYKVADIIEGKFNLLNVSEDRINNSEIYIWSWKKGENGKWSKQYEVQGTTLLVDNEALQLEGFLFAAFTKGYVIPDVNVWDENVQKQTIDIIGSVLEQGYLDGSGF